MDNDYFDGATIVDLTKSKSDDELDDLFSSIDSVCGACPISQENSDAYCEECPVRILWQQVAATYDERR